jgi:hypothetical protein
VGGCRLGTRASGHDSHGPAGQVKAESSGPQWSDYIPVRAHRACTLSSHYHSEVAGSPIDVRTEARSSYRNVEKAPDGIHFTVHTATRTSSPDEAPSTKTSDLPYVLASDGTLKTTPNLHLTKSDALNFTIDGFVVYPTVRAVRNGRGIHPTMKATMTATDPSLQAELKKEAGTDSITSRLTLNVSGVPPEPVRTSAGTFTDVVGVHVKIAKISSSLDDPQVQQAFSALSQLFGSYTTWYARDVGPVAVRGEGGLAKLADLELERCTPPIPAADIQGPPASEQPRDASESASPRPISTKSLAPGSRHEQCPDPATLAHAYQDANPDETVADNAVSNIHCAQGWASGGVAVYFGSEPAGGTGVANAVPGLFHSTDGRWHALDRDKLCGTGRIPVSLREICKVS